MEIRWIGLAGNRAAPDEVVLTLAASGLPEVQSSSRYAAHTKTGPPEHRRPCSPKQRQRAVTFVACGPFWPCVMSNETFWFSSRLR